jgi:hypothetical protein
MINQFSTNGGFILPENQYNYVSQLSMNTSIGMKMLNFPKKVKDVTKRDNSKSIKINDEIYSNQESELLIDPTITFAGNQQSVKMLKEVNDLKMTKKVSIRGELPKEIKRRNYEKIIEKINQNFVSDWQNIKELEGKDIDVNLSFESDPESSALEMIYTIYVMDLDKNDVEIVWNKLRKLFNRIINNLKHSQPRYRKKIEEMERLAVIHIEW